MIAKNVKIRYNKMCFLKGKYIFMTGAFMDSTGVPRAYEACRRVVSVKTHQFIITGKTNNNLAVAA